MIYLIKIYNHAEWANDGDFSYLNIVNDLIIFTGHLKHSTAFDDSVDSYEDMVKRMSATASYEPTKVKLYDIDELVDL